MGLQWFLKSGRKEERNLIVNNVGRSHDAREPRVFYKIAACIINDMTKKYEGFKTGTWDKIETAEDSIIFIFSRAYTFKNMFSPWI